MNTRLTVIVVLGLGLIGLNGCGTFRMGSGSYNSGVGTYKTPSDYAADEGALRKLPEHTTYEPHGPFQLFWPVQAVHISRGFHDKSEPDHAGLDLTGPMGTAILAAHEGLVVYVGHDFSGYGNMVLLEYSGEWATLYGHLEKITAKEGQILAAGDPLGTMGATGRASGVHLHFEVMHHRQPVDPINLLSGAPRFAKKSKRATHARR